MMGKYTLFPNYLEETLSIPNLESITFLLEDAEVEVSIS